MRDVPSAAALVLLMMTWSVAIPAAQETAAPARIALTPPQMEEFLLRAKVVRTRRDVIVKLFETRIAERGEGAMVYTLRR